MLNRTGGELMQNNIKMISLKVFGVIVALLSIFPLFWMALAGFKPETEVLAYPFKFFSVRVGLLKLFILIPIS